MRRAWTSAAVLAATVLGTSAAGLALYVSLMPPGRALPGAFIEGRVPPADASLGDWLEDRRQALLQRSVLLKLPDDVIETTLGELGVELDVAETLRRLREERDRGSLSQQLFRAVKARRGELDFEGSWSFDPERAKATLERIAPQVRREPMDARLDLTGHARVEERAGHELDMAKTLEELSSGSREEDALFEVRLTTIPARVTIDMLASVDVSRVLGAFETSFKGTGRGRAQNIRRAAEYLNGTIIAPGQTLSFNKLVGPRTVERGFTWAPVITNDELEPGVGGGVCQVASTLHAAAVLGALDVPQRRSHSRPSGYAPLGLDATVIDGEVDLKIRNPYETPLMVHAYLPIPSRIRVELLGREPPGDVEHLIAVVEKHPFFRRVTTKTGLEPGRQVKKQKGIFGYDVVSVVRVKRPDGSVATRQYKSKYYPVPEVFWVAPGHDATALPDLPEGATHVEVDAGASSAAPTG
jgi:vancomycin resistance protein YoaR